jgi:hypothetical protein
MSEPAHALHKETEAAKVLLATYRDILADDDQAKMDMVEGETNIQEAIRAGLVRLAEIRAMGVGIDDMIDRLKSRRERLAGQQGSLREAILLAMELAGLPKFETDVGTITRKRTPPSVVVVEEADIPSMFWKPSDPKLDKRALLDALKGGDAIPGAQLSNGGETLQVRWE